MRVRVGAFVGTLGLVAAATVGLAVPAQAAVVTVGPGESIQAAIDSVPPGSTVNVLPGVYTQSFGVTKDDISVVGSGPGATIVQSPPFPEGPCFDLGGTIGACVRGEIDFINDVVTNPTSNARISGFTFRNFLSFGAMVIGGENAVLTGNRYENNRVYGIYANNSTGTQILDSIATGSEEAGIYIGDSPNANALVRRNDVSDNRYGIFIRAASFGLVTSNNAHDNCEGIFLLGAPSRTTDWVVSANRVDRNNKACPPRGLSAATSGAGIVLVNSHNNTVVGNTVNGNVPTGPTSTSGGIAMISGTGNRIQRNMAFGNVPVDIMNVAGPTNVVANNACGTSIPPGLCSAQPIG